MWNSGRYQLNLERQSVLVKKKTKKNDEAQREFNGMCNMCDAVSRGPVLYASMCGCIDSLDAVIAQVGAV